MLVKGGGTGVRFEFLQPVRRVGLSGTVQPLREEVLSDKRFPGLPRLQPGPMLRSSVTLEILVFELSYA